MKHKKVPSPMEVTEAAEDKNGTKRLKNKKKKRSRCILCKKKRTFADTINLCKCRQPLCAACRREHDCEFDYAAVQKEQQLATIESAGGATGAYEKLPDRL